jgi:hypothetical protein
MRMLFILASFQNYENVTESNQLTGVGKRGWEAKVCRGVQGYSVNPALNECYSINLTPLHKGNANTNFSLANCLEVRSFFTVNT